MGNRWIVELEDPTGNYSRERVEQFIRRFLLDVVIESDQGGNSHRLRLVSLKAATLPPAGGASQ